MLNSRLKIVLFYSVSAVFLLLNFYFIISKDTLIVSALPFALAVILVAILRLDILLLSVVFFTPLSVPLKELISGLSFDMNLPTEPLLFGVLVLFILKVVGNRGFDKQVLRHPVSIAIYFYLFWMLLTCLTSTMPLVSLKYWLSKVWFLAAFYFMANILFRNIKNYYWFVGLYTAAFMVVIAYAWYRHLGYGFYDQQAAHFVMNPFYKDHTSYGAMLAFFVPLLAGFSFHKEYKGIYRFWAFICLSIVFAALILSYTRAAWLSLVVGVGVWVIMKLKIRFRPLFITFLTVLAILLVFQTRILMFLERNDQESSANLSTHISSMTNVTSDASNLERINRWSCAIRMFEEKPVLGWGPGTYMFQYAPFQLTQDRTIISTNSGDMGNAHSEYLGALSESGILGMLSFILLVVFVYYIGINAYSRTDNREYRMLLLSSIVALTTYLVHGFLNNFLDTDKAAVPFWGCVALIVMLDIKIKSTQDKFPETKKASKLEAF